MSNLYIQCMKCNIYHLRASPKHTHYDALEYYCACFVCCFIRVYDCSIKVDLFFDVLNLFQHDYCTSNQDLQNIVEPEPPHLSHLLSCTLAITSSKKYSQNFHDKFHPENLNCHYFLL